MLPRYALSLTLLLSLWAGAALAQQSIVEPDPKRDARRALRDAKRYPAAEDLRQTHLAVGKQDMRPGESGTRQRNPDTGSDRYRFDNTGAARVSDQKMVTTRAKVRKQPKSSQ